MAHPTKESVREKEGEFRIAAAALIPNQKKEASSPAAGKRNP